MEPNPYEAPRFYVERRPRGFEGLARLLYRHPIAVAFAVTLAVIAWLTAGILHAVMNTEYVV
jgi:hypothetical protein